MKFKELLLKGIIFVLFIFGIYYLVKWMFTKAPVTTAPVTTAPGTTTTSPTVYNLCSDNSLCIKSTTDAVSPVEAFGSLTCPNSLFLTNNMFNPINSTILWDGSLPPPDILNPLTATNSYCCPNSTDIVYNNKCLQVIIPTCQQGYILSQLDDTLKCIPEQVYVAPTGPIEMIVTDYKCPDGYIKNPNQVLDDDLLCMKAP
jgi:hypothetical protein